MHRMCLVSGVDNGNKVLDLFNGPEFKTKSRWLGNTGPNKGYEFSFKSVSEQERSP